MRKGTPVKLYKITIHNFYSYIHQEINFEQLNIFTGLSDSGKSNILKAIYWVCFNRPLGNNMFNDRMGNDICYVRLEFENGIVERFKNWDENGYKLNDKTYLNVGTDVPVEIKWFLNIDKINFQTQFEGSFLLGAGSKEVSRYVNNLLGLKIIDDVLGSVESDQRESSKNIKKIESEIEKLRAEYDSLNWLDNAKAIIGKIKNLKEEKIKQSELLEMVKTYENQKKVLNEITEKEHILTSTHKLYVEEKEIISTLEKVGKCLDNKEFLENIDLSGVCPVCGGNYEI